MCGLGCDSDVAFYRGEPEACGHWLSDKPTREGSWPEAWNERLPLVSQRGMLISASTHEPAAGACILDARAPCTGKPMPSEGFWNKRKQES